jgi:hypothetical protein
MIINTLKKLGKKSLSEIDPLKLLMKKPDLPESERKALAGKILGIHRRYKRDVLVEITTWALATDSSPASKHKIEQWQEASFGHSVSNNVLATWCKSDRGCGERAEFAISEETTAMAKELFAVFEHALKVEIDARRLKTVGGQILGEALGL